MKEERTNATGIVVDSGYKTPAIAKLILDDGKTPIMPYKRPMTKTGFLMKYEYAYDEYYDCYICPNNQVLNYSTTNHEGYREYKSDKNKRKECLFRKQCTGSKDCVKVVTRHVWEDYLEKVEDIRHTRGIKEIYSLRSQTIERVFADAKEKHGMRYTQYRGIKKVRMELNLLFVCMNLKRLAKWLDRLGLAPTDPSSKTSKLTNIILDFNFQDIIVTQCSKIVRRLCNLRTILSTV